MALRRHTQLSVYDYYVRLLVSRFDLNPIWIRSLIIELIPVAGWNNQPVICIDRSNRSYCRRIATRFDSRFSLLKSGQTFPGPQRTFGSVVGLARPPGSTKRQPGAVLRESNRSNAHFFASFPAMTITRCSTLEAASSGLLGITSTVAVRRPYSILDRSKKIARPPSSTRTSGERSLRSAP